MAESVLSKQTLCGFPVDYHPSTLQSQLWWRDNMIKLDVCSWKLETRCFWLKIRDGVRSHVQAKWRARRRWWICERVVEWSWKGVEIYVFSVKTVRVTLPQYPSCCWMLSGRNWRRVIPCDCVIKHNLIRSLCARCVGLYEGFVGFNLGPFLRDKALIKSNSGQVKRKCRNKTIFQKRFFDNNAIRRRWGRVGWSLITISWLVLWCMSWVELRVAKWIL